MITTSFTQEKAAFIRNKSLAEAELAFAQMSIEKGQKEAFLEYLGDKGIMFVPEPTTAQVVFSGAPPTQLPQKRVLYWEPYLGDVATSDDLGFNIGPWAGRENTPEKKILGQGYFLSVWKRLPEGNWHEFVDMGIRLPAPTADHSFGKPFRLLRAVGTPVSNKKWDNDKITDWEQKFSALSQDKGLLAVYQEMSNDETIILRYGIGLIEGKNSITKYVTDNKFDKLSVELSPLDSDISKNGDMAYSYGKYQLNAGKDMKETGYYVHVWRRTGKDQWKIAAENMLPNQLPK